MSPNQFHLHREFKVILVLVPSVLLIGTVYMFWPGDDATAPRETAEDAPETPLGRARPAVPLPVRKPTFAQKIREMQAAAVSSAGSKPDSNPTGEDAPADEDEAFMVKLRGLWFDNPEEGLKMATEAEQRFKDTPRAAECAWIAVRCVVEMGDFPKARTMAEKMQETYPQTHWSLDVKRHLLVRPPDR